MCDQYFYSLLWFAGTDFIYYSLHQVTCTLAKEIQLKHRAPVIGITVLDGAAVPLPDPLEVSHFAN